MTDGPTSLGPTNASDSSSAVPASGSSAVPASGSSAATVLAGPVLRRTEPSSLSVWLALSHPATVVLRVFDCDGGQCLEGDVETVAIGTHLHLALVSAKQGSGMDWGNSYTYEVLIGGKALDVTELLYDDGPSRLSFVLPGKTLADTRLCHGSCRHPTMPGKDALSILDDLIERSFASNEQADKRPQLFVCSGDMIYADTPSPSMLQMVGEIGDRLLGYKEPLPGLEYSASEIPKDQRRNVCEKSGIYELTDRQLFGFGEYLTLHLLVISPLLWPEDVPDELQRFFRTLPKVRRALANTSFYAIFDDHEVTDDWNLTRAWASRVLASPIGRRMVSNALSAFALVHTWGNQPAEFAPDRVGGEILRQLTGKAPAGEIEAALGIPESVGDTLSPPPGALPWHFRLLTPAMDLRVFDTRTQRHFPSAEPHGIPDHLSPAAMQQQFSPPFVGMPVLIFSAPLAPPPMSGMAKWIRRREHRWETSDRELSDVYLPDRGDEWVPRSNTFQALIDRLPSTWVSLGGDTHIAYAAELVQESGRSAVFVSSGMQRESLERRWRQHLGFSYPWPFWPGRPSIQTETFKLQYLKSETSSQGKQYEYLAHNNIGTLVFERKGESWCAVHTLWWRAKELVSVPYRVILGR